jgi:hypothetical protein
MEAMNTRRFFVELRFWDRGLADGILALLAGDFAMRLLDRRRDDAASWVRLELSGDARKIEPLRRLGREHGFYVGSPTAAVA